MIGLWWRCNDTLLGGSDNDYLDGAFGGYTSEQDKLTGGSGADVFSLGYTGSYTEIKLSRRRIRYYN
jgi:Ca2+-binding RTX toxin-like protein